MITGPSWHTRPVPAKNFFPPEQSGSRKPVMVSWLDSHIRSDYISYAAVKKQTTQTQKPEEPSQRSGHVDYCSGNIIISKGGRGCSAVLYPGMGTKNILHNVNHNLGLSNICS